MKYGVLAHRRDGRLPDLDSWCKDETGGPIVFESRAEAQELADEYNENLKTYHRLGSLRFTTP